MSKYASYCLTFAGICLLAGALIAAADWLACTRGHGGVACRVSRSDAVAAFSGAANVALGVALQDRQP